MKPEPDYLLPEDDAGCFQLTETARGLIALALREKAGADDGRAAAYAISSGIFKEQARAARMLAGVFDGAIAHVQLPTEGKD